MQLVGSWGKAFITGKWSESDTIQHKSRSWTHSLSSMKRLVAAEGGSIEIVEQGNKETIGEDVRIGIFSLVPAR